MNGPRIVCIVEGHGEVEAVPILLRRIGTMLDAPAFPEALPPLRIPASKLLKAGELERAIEFAARKAGQDGRILVLLDCDDGCPAEAGPELLAWASTARPDRVSSVVMAKREFEAWFIASIDSLRGLRGIPADAARPENPESIRDAKGWLSRVMAGNRGYSETTDQPALAAQFDITSARSADSFDKFYREVERLLAAQATRSGGERDDEE